MPTVRALDHVNIQTRAVAETARFFAEVLDLVPGPVAPGVDMARITWMFDAQERAVVHITAPGMTFAEEAERDIGRDTGALHHVAFECEGHDAMLARLDRLGHPYRCRAVSAIGLRQVFVAEPNGVMLELNFRGGE